MIYKKYDALLDKAYKQLELAVSPFELIDPIFFDKISQSLPTSPLTLDNTTSSNTTTKSGTTETESSTIESTHLTSLSIVSSFSCNSEIYSR